MYARYVAKSVLPSNIYIQLHIAFIFSISITHERNAKPLLLSLCQGEYRLGSMQSCAQCPRGWECSKTDGSANKPCQLGYWSDAGATECIPCKKGFAWCVLAVIHVICS